MNKTICFAYFSDNKFLGWYGDSFGSISKTPKLYSDFNKIKDIISKSFFQKIKKIKESSFDQEKNSVTNIVSALGLAIFSHEEMLRGKEVELRVVECPIYDGPNPDFNEEEYVKESAAYKQKMKDAGIFDIPAPSLERLDAIRNFEAKNPRPKLNDWIYADMKKVKEWAQNEPTEFIEIIKPDAI
jgi:hypothetical protein